MKKILTLSITTASLIYAGGDIAPQVCHSDIKAPTATATTLAEAFSLGKVSGQIRAGYIWQDPSANSYLQNYTTAIGGVLRYETAPLYGFSGGVGFYTSHAIMPLSGDRDEGKFNESMASDDKYYDILAEAYLNYQYENLNIRIGRQLIDTPYADSDDIRMTPNTFEGILASYQISDFTLLGAYLSKWQGPDAEYKFEDLLEDGDGVALLAVTYSKDDLEAGIWYYNADNSANIFYIDASKAFQITNDINTKISMQYANQSEIDNSGIDASLYGAMVEFGYHGLSLSVAYDKVDVDSGSSYFGGFGGGVGYVNMYETTAASLAENSSVESYKLAIAYEFNSDLNIGFEYGNFKNDAKDEIDEYDFIVEYNINDSLSIDVTYAKIDATSKQDSFKSLLVRANYNF
jgi:hypothetical protein